jgi:hypothetical protein
VIHLFGGKRLIVTDEAMSLVASVVLDLAPGSIRNRALAYWANRKAIPVLPIAKIGSISGRGLRRYRGVGFSEEASGCGNRPRFSRNASVFSIA